MSTLIESDVTGRLKQCPPLINCGCYVNKGQQDAERTNATVNSVEICISLPYFLAVCRNDLARSWPPLNPQTAGGTYTSQLK